MIAVGNLEKERCDLLQTPAHNIIIFLLPCLHQTKLGKKEQVLYQRPKVHAVAIYIFTRFT